MKEVENRHRERRTLGRIGTGTELIEETETVAVGLAQDTDGVRHVRGEGRQILLDGLLVTDVGEDLLEHTELRAFGGRDEETGLAHQLEETDGLQAHGLTTGVRSRDDEKIEFLAEIYRDRYDLLRVDQRMPALQDIDVVVIIQHRTGGPHGGRQLRLREDEVEVREDLDILSNLFSVWHQGAGQGIQDLLDLLLFVGLELTDVIIQLDDAHRLDEERRSRRTLVVDHAREARLILRLHRETVATIAHGDDRVLQQGTAAVQNPVQRRVDALLQRMLFFTYAEETGTRIVGDLILREDAADDLLIDRRERFDVTEVRRQCVVCRFLPELLRIRLILRVVGV